MNLSFLLPSFLSFLPLSSNPGRGGRRVEGHAKAAVVDVGKVGVAAVDKLAADGLFEG